MLRFRSIVSALALIALAAAPAGAQSRLPTQGYADLVERLSPAVVNIATSQRVEGLEDMPRFPPGTARAPDGDGAAQVTSLGSGFIISADGVVVTNNHVIEIRRRDRSDLAERSAL
ncbi:MAG: S1C family serine protease [Hyphomonadaceae bacterium JAD_PAG50586_4]|nr:MAG: S1C family serine protease [Hyphomonadaceae bacterium JAD_PAG50586_4]